MIETNVCGEVVSMCRYVAHETRTDEFDSKLDCWPFASEHPYESCTKKA